MQVATLATRQAKERDLSEATLRETWRVKGEEVHLDRESIGRRLGSERPGQTVLSARQVEHSVTAHASHFDRRAAIQAVADNLPHGARAAEVEQLADAFLASEQVIEIARGPRGATYTTQRIWELERKALAEAERMASASDRAVAGEIIAGRVLDARPSLKPDQREMVRRLLCERRGPGRRDRRGRHGQDLRGQRRGVGLGGGGDQASGRGADLAGGERAALRGP